MQVGTVIEGDAIYASKIRMKKQVTSYTDYYLKLDQEKSFSRRKFNELQKLNQRKKRLKRKIIKKKTKNNGKWFYYYMKALTHPNNPLSVQNTINIFINSLYNQYEVDQHLSPHSLFTPQPLHTPPPPTPTINYVHPF